ncbi:molybdopterin synthase [Salarchaeum sp. JOR-1]|uniref:molybdopterin synthase n=1 Tax=Salarchaeum sp. JOR-1 TaxID=2599399 RepID=UPI001198CB9C|nr:molybdopterin synthase [Salarchaeum sp. JOR-1]QDX40482.1 molybdopterin synthase [Salarchaeum sp. JOR-1]
MHVLGLATGPGVPADPLADRLAADLPGTVAVVERSAGAGGDPTRYELGPEGSTVSRPGGDLLGALDDLARDHDYAVLVGFADVSVPHVVVGDADAETALVRVSTPEEVETDAVVRALADRDEHESRQSLVAEVTRAPSAEFAGAVATFTGIVREREGPGDDRTESLTFEKYEGVAAERLARIRDELEARDGVHEVRLHHRTGRIEAGADIVFVVVLAGHRREAFETVADGIDRLKDEVPIFKKELTVEDEFWTHERGE